MTRVDCVHFTPDALPHWDGACIERAEVRPEFSMAQRNKDRAQRAARTPAGHRHARAAGAVAQRAALGLVPDQTTVQAACFSLSAQQSGAEVKARHEALAKDLGSFALDTPARRLMKLRMAVGFSARAHAVSEKGRRSDRAWMVTFTYRDGVQWRPEHVADALRCMRKWCAKKGIPFRYVWVIEPHEGKRRADGVARTDDQGRAVPHYHCVVWLPVRVRCPHFDNRGWWPHGMTRADPPVPEQVRNPVGYLLHYLKKDKDLSGMPKGARAYGVGGLDYSLRRARRWLGLPAFVQGNSDIGDDWKRAVGGGWISPSGVRYESEFEPVLVGGIRSMVRVCTHPRQIEPSGPFSWARGWDA